MIIVSDPSADATRPFRTGRYTAARRRSSAARGDTPRYASARPISVHTEVPRRGSLRMADRLWGPPTSGRSENTRELLRGVSASQGWVSQSIAWSTGLREKSPKSTRAPIPSAAEAILIRALACPFTMGGLTGNTGSGGQKLHLPRMRALPNSCGVTVRTFARRYSSPLVNGWSTAKSTQGHTVC
jgi:hypothetical protein